MCSRMSTLFALPSNLGLSALLLVDPLSLHFYAEGFVYDQPKQGPSLQEP